MTAKTEAPLPVSSQCFVCGKDNHRGLRLRFYRRSDGSSGGDQGEDQVVARFELEEDLNGFTERTHGGVVAALLDEAMGWATVLAGRRFTYTVELNVRYRLPVPTRQELEVVGWVDRHTRRLSFAGAEIRDLEDTVLASAKGKFMLTSEAETRRIDAQLIYGSGVKRVLE